MNPLAELRRILTARSGRQTGTILAIASGQADVATAAGVQSVSIGQVTAAKGDRVAIEQGVVIGKLSAASPPVYEV